MTERILSHKEVDYTMPTEVIFGRNVLKEIVAEPIIVGAKRIILAVGDHFKTTKEFRCFKEQLEKSGKSLVVYGYSIGVSDLETINNLLDFVRKNLPDIVIAIGGGTILDSAKCAAILAINSGGLEDFLKRGKKIESKGINFIAVPTTAGTGSEVTPWATVWDTLSKEKYSLSSPLMFPILAVVDPSLTDELPSKITAETGMDALTQAIEAFWSKYHNGISDRYALEAIRLIIKNLYRVVVNPDKEFRDAMARASLYTGLAFSNTKTTICHSVSYPMTAHFGISHGQAVSITLPSFIRYSLPVLEEKRKNLLLLAIGVETIEEAAVKIESLMKKMGLATRLVELGIKEEDLDLLVKEGYNPDRVINAPRVPTTEELRLMLKEIL